MSERQGTKPRIETGNATLLGAMFGGSTGGAIEASERRGQSELVESTALPTKWNGPNRDEELTALGFELGDVHSDDPLFREAKLPPGWTKKGSSHAMWSYINDEQGRERISIFYKAAFYDREAFMNLSRVPE